jgi:hypothetical protein
MRKDQKCTNIYHSDFTHWKTNAFRRSHGKTWAITFEDLERLYIIQNGLCALTGEKLNRIQGDKNMISLDRIDSAKGYTMDNVQLTGTHVNLAKHISTMEEFIEMCRKVVNWNRKKAKNVME